MTQNQLKYREITETQRANLAKEKENTRHNRVTEAISANQLVEAQRTNKANEAIKSRQASTAQFSANESARHNVEQERVNLLDAATRQQQAKTAERQVQVGLKNVEVAKQSLAETSRHNKRTEDISVFSATANSISNLIGSGIRAITTVGGRK